jgi:hypothetical protein
MNIFYTNHDPRLAALDLADPHIVKMPSEATQMIVQSLRDNGCPQELLPLAQSTGEPHKGGYPNHPATKWTMQTRNNFNWVLEWGLALCKEFKSRFGKEHYCYNGLMMIDSQKLRRYIKRGKISKPPRCFKGHDDLRDSKIWKCGVEANREYYIRDKNRPTIGWNKNRAKPEWWRNDE